MLTIGVAVEAKLDDSKGQSVKGRDANEIVEDIYTECVVGINGTDVESMGEEQEIWVCTESMSSSRKHGYRRHGCRRHDCRRGWVWLLPSKEEWIMHHAAEMESSFASLTA